MALAPIEDPRWATDGAAQIDIPVSGKKDIGFEFDVPGNEGEKPPVHWFNWLFNRIFLWTLHLRGVTEDMDTEFMTTTESSPLAMTVEVSAGRVSYGDTNIDFAGGTSPAFSAADATDPRVDLLFIDTAGTLAILEGTPDPSPDTPSHEGLLVLAEVTIPATATTITASEIKDVRPWITSRERDFTVKPSTPEALTVEVSTGRATYGVTTIIFAGGTSPAFAAADVTNPRIDLLFLDDAGALAIDTGTPAASPVANSHEGKFMLAEVTILANATTIDLSNIADARAFLQASVKNNTIEEQIQTTGQINLPDLTVSTVDLTGASVDVTDPGTYLVMAHALFQFVDTNAAIGPAFVYINDGSTDFKVITAQEIDTGVSGQTQKTLSASKTFTITGSTTFKLTGDRVAAGGIIRIIGAGTDETKITVIRISA